MVSRKIRKTLICIILVIIAIELVAVLSNNFFFEKVSAKEAAMRSLTAVSGNAIKHAYASSIVYSRLRDIFVSESIAEEITIALGKANEIAEIIFKPQQDTTLEMLKDLQNNLLGICAAKLIEENPDNPAIQDRISLIGNLAQNDRLILTRDNVILSKELKEKISGTRSYETAVELFYQNRDKISCDFDIEIEE